MYKKIAIILLLSAISAILTILTRIFLIENTIFIDMESLGVFYSVFGVMYAIIAGFILVEVLRKYTTLTDLIQEELNSIHDIRDFIIYFDYMKGKTRKNIISSLHKYVQSIMEVEWISMKNRKEISSDTSKELSDFMKALNAIEMKKGMAKAASPVVISELAKITSFRTKRITLSFEKIPTGLYFLLLFMSVIVIVGFILTFVNNVWIHLFLVLATTISVIFLYIIINDLDNPFDGMWNVSYKEIEELEKNLNGFLLKNK